MKIFHAKSIYKLMIFKMRYEWGGKKIKEAFIGVECCYRGSFSKTFKPFHYENDKLFCLHKFLTLIIFNLFSCFFFVNLNCLFLCKEPLRMFTRAEKTTHDDHKKLSHHRYQDNIVCLVSLSSINFFKFFERFSTIIRLIMSVE